MDKHVEAVKAVHPKAHVRTHRTYSSNEERYVVVDGTTAWGKWLTGECRTEAAAWKQAAKKVKGASCDTSK